MAAISAERQFFDERTVTTLFAFDDVSIPFSQNLKLVMRTSEKHPANPVGRRGRPKARDSWAVQSYGSVIRDGDKYRMWYIVDGKDRASTKGLG